MDQRAFAGLLGTALCWQAALAGTSGGYRGPQTNGIYPAVGLLKAWPKEGPKLLWKHPLEQGYAGVTVADGKVYVASGAGTSKLDVLSLDGTLLLRVPVGPAGWKRFSGTRSTPLVMGNLVVTTTPDANIYATDLDKQEARWKVNAWADFGMGKGDMGWGSPESPLLHDDTVIFNACSRYDETPPIIALDFRTGKVVWAADAGTGRKVSAADVSGAVFRHRGRDLIAYPTWRYLLCLDAGTGKELWAIRQVSSKNLTPVYNDDLLLWSPGGKAQMLQLGPDGATYKVLWTRSIGARSFSHAVVLGGRLYMFSSPYLAPKQPDPLGQTFADSGTVYELAPSDDDAPEKVRRLGPAAVGNWRRDASRVVAFVCLDARTGKLLHSIPAGTEGHVIAADGMVYATDLAKQPDDVVNIRIRLIKPTESGFEVAGEFFPNLSVDELCWASARNARSPKHLQWAREDFTYQRNVNPVIAEGRLFVRYGPLMAFDLRGKDYQPTGGPPPSAEPPDRPPARVLTTRPAEITDADVPVLLRQLGDRLAENRKTAAVLIGELDSARSEKLVPRLVDLVTSADNRSWLVQQSAADALNAMGPAAAKAAVPSLLKELPVAVRKGDAALAKLLLDTLRRIDEEAPRRAAEPVGRLLRHEDPHVRYQAAVALGRMGPAAAQAAEALAGAVTAEDPQVATAAGAALAAIGRAAERAIPSLSRGLVEAVERKRSPWCGLILGTLEKIGPKAVAPAVPQVADLLRHADADVRHLAARTLTQAGAAAAGAIPALLEALESADARVAELAAEALVGMGSEAATAAVALAELIARSRGPVRLTAARLVEKIGPDAAPAAGLLGKALKDKDPAVARACAKTLGALGPAAKAAVPALTDALSSADPELVGQAAAALGAIGPGAKPAAPALRAVLKQAHYRALPHVVAALTQLDQPPVNDLVDMLRSGKGHARRSAVDALGRLGPKAAPAVPELVGALGDADKHLSAAAARALGAIGEPAKDAAPALVKILAAAQGKQAVSTEDSRLASAAAGALGRLAAAAKDVPPAAVPALIRALAAADGNVASAAAAALGGIGKDAEPAIGPLVAASEGADARRADAIRRALAHIKAKTETKNAPPQAHDQTVTCEEGKTAVIDLPVADADDVTATLRATIADKPAQGRLEQLGNLAFVYHGRPGFIGKDSFTFKATDAADDSRVARVTVTLTPDTTGPHVTKVVAQGPADSVAVSFDEPLAAEAAARAENYSIDNGVRVLKAQPDETGRIVALTTSPLARNSPNQQREKR